MCGKSSLILVMDQCVLLFQLIIWNLPLIDNIMSFVCVCVSVLVNNVMNVRGANQYIHSMDYRTIKIIQWVSILALWIIWIQTHSILRKKWVNSVYVRRNSNDMTLNQAKSVHCSVTKKTIFFSQWCFAVFVRFANFCKFFKRGDE